MESKENHPIIIHKAGAKAAVFFLNVSPFLKKTPRKTKDTQVEAFQSARAAWLESASVLVRPLAPERGLSAHIPRRFNPMFTLQPSHPSLFTVSVRKKCGHGHGHGTGVIYS